MDPHGDSQAQTQVEVGAAVLDEVVLQPLGVFGDVQRDEGDAARLRVGLLRPLNKAFIQVEAQEVNFPLVRLLFRLLQQMLVKGHTQFLTSTERKTGRLCNGVIRIAQNIIGIHLKHTSEKECLCRAQRILKD